MTPDQIAQSLSNQLRRINFIRRDQEIINASTRLSNLFAQNQGGGYIRRPIQVRANRIDLELSQEAKRSFLKRSNALFQADDFLAARPWWSGTATQASNFLKRQMVTMLSTDSSYMAKRKRIAALEGQYGLTGAESIVAEEDAERVAEAKRARKGARAKGRFNAWFDSLEDWEKDKFQLTQRYGGGQEGARRAEEAQRRSAFRQFPWLKTLNKAGIIQVRDIPKMAKYLEKLSKTPVIGSLIKHPGILIGSAFAGVMYKYMSYASQAAKLGALADFTGISLARLKSAGHTISDWGGSEKDIASSMSGFMGAQGLMMMGLGGTEHLKKDALALGGNILGSGKYGFMTSQERMERYSKAIREAYRSGDANKGVALAQLAGFSPAMVEAVLQGKDFWSYTSFYESKDSFLGSKKFGEGINRVNDDPFAEVSKSWTNLIKGGMGYGIPGMNVPTLYPHGISDKVKQVDAAARSADSFNSGAYNTDDKQSSTRSVNITINTGDLSLPNVQNANDFVMALSNDGIRRSQRAEILTTFDTMAV